MPSVLAVVAGPGAMRKSEELTTTAVKLDNCIILPALPWKAIASVCRERRMIHGVSRNPRLETPSTSLVRTQTEGLMHDVNISCAPQEKPNMIEFYTANPFHGPRPYKGVPNGA